MLTPAGVNALMNVERGTSAFAFAPAVPSQPVKRIGYVWKLSSVPFLKVKRMTGSALLEASWRTPVARFAVEAP